MSPLRPWGSPSGYAIRQSTVATKVICAASFRIKTGGRAMTETRRYTIEVKDAKSKSAVVAAVVDWTSDDKQVAVAQIFRLPGLASSNGLVHRLSQQHSAIRHPTIAAKQARKRRA